MKVLDFNVGVAVLGDPENKKYITTKNVGAGLVSAHGEATFLVKIKVER
jgi:hypothetical protein